MRRNLGRKRKKHLGKKPAKTQRAFAKVPRNTHYIYKLTVGNRVYWGYTSRDPLIRLEEHLKNAREGKANKLYNYLRKAEFKHSFEIVEQFNDEYRALCRECELIHKDNTMKAGLNSSMGGEGYTMILDYTLNDEGQMIFRRRAR